MFIPPTGGIRAHGGMGQRWQGYCRFLSQLERGQYITPSKPIKPTQMILEKAQQMSIIANGARQR